MKKKSAIIFFLSLFVLPAFSQDKPKYLTNFFFGDTIVEVGHIKIEYKFPMAYGDRFKVQAYMTNLTDSFKIIEPSDFKFTSEGTAYGVNRNNPLVIPPKTTRRFRLVAKGTTFKHNQIKTSITNIQTSGKIKNIYAPKELMLKRGSQTSVIEPLKLRLEQYEYKSKDILIVHVGVSYSGSEFLGIHVKKIKVISSDGKAFVNKKQTRNSLYYNKDKKEVMLLLEFENPRGTSKKTGDDRVIFDDVFVEYNLDKNPENHEFIFIKNGEGLGNPPKEDKEKDIEVIED